MNISYRSLYQLTRWESYQFLFSAENFIGSHSAGMPELFNNKFADFQAAFKAFDDALALERRTAPKALLEAEEGRDLAIRKIYSIIREFSVFPFEKEKEDAANLLLRAFKPYGTGSSIAAMAQEEETAVLTNLIQDFDQSEALNESFDLLGLRVALEALKTHNSLFVEMQLQRTRESARFVVGVAKDSRTEAENQFISLVQLINALALVEGEEKYAELKLEINRLHKQALARTSQRTKKKEDETGDEVTDPDVTIEE